MYRKHRKGIEAQVPELLSSSEFKEALYREKSRSNRTFRPFTCLTFKISTSIGDQPRYEKALVALASIAHENVRSYDVKGWHKNQSDLGVGVILCDTLPDRSRRVIEIINQHFQQALKSKKISMNGEFRLTCDIWSYPNETAPHVETADSAHLQSGFTTVRCEDCSNPCSYTIPFWKRGFDIVGALVGLTVLSPLFLVVAALIKLVSPGPVFYKQVRIGYQGKRFDMLKFRTMHTNSDPSIHEQYVKQLIKESQAEEDHSTKPMKKIENDPRIIPFGNILRKSSIDELPQLFNVLKGEMSLVGPRPAIPYEFEEYKCWHKMRVDTIPGMTGLWQVMGKNDISFKDMVRLDIKYARNISLWLDLKILLMTPVTIFSQLKDGLTKKVQYETEAVNNV